MMPRPLLARIFITSACCRVVVRSLCLVCWVYDYVTVCSTLVGCPVFVRVSPSVALPIGCIVVSALLCVILRSPPLWNNTAFSILSFGADIVLVVSDDVDTGPYVV